MGDGMVMCDSGSFTCHEIVPSDVCQPFAPNVPVTVGVMVGAVVSGDCASATADEAPSAMPTIRTVTAARMIRRMLTSYVDDRILWPACWLKLDCADVAMHDEVGVTVSRSLEPALVGRWQLASFPLSIAGLPASGSCVRVVQPLSASGPSIGSTRLALVPTW